MKGGGKASGGKGGKGTQASREFQSKWSDQKGMNSGDKAR